MRKNQKLQVKKLIKKKNYLIALIMIIMEKNIKKNIQRQ